MIQTATLCCVYDLSSAPLSICRLVAVMTDWLMSGFLSILTAGSVIVWPTELQSWEMQWSIWKKDKLINIIPSVMYSHCGKAHMWTCENAKCNRVLGLTVPNLFFAAHHAVYIMQPIMCWFMFEWSLKCRCFHVWMNECDVSVQRIPVVIRVWH